jgi:hypothetical protein
LFLDKLDSFGTVVKRNKIPATNIESIEVFNCILGVVDIFIYNESGAFFIAFGAFADLSDRAKAIEDLVELLVSDFVGEVADEDDFVDLWGQFDDSLLF